MEGYAFEFEDVVVDRSPGVYAADPRYDAYGVTFAVVFRLRDGALLDDVGPAFAASGVLPLGSAPVVSMEEQHAPVYADNGEERRPPPVVHVYGCTQVACARNREHHPQRLHCLLRHLM